jgi:hypothetical protein
MSVRIDVEPPRQYTRDDVQVFDDPIDFIRRRPAMFFRRGEFSPDEAVERVVGEALRCGAADLAIKRLGAWWIIWSKRDWLPPRDHHTAFQRIVSYPEGGQNSMRAEVLLTAFASDVVTQTGTGLLAIKGAPDSELRRFLSQHGDVGRVVAFRP